MFFIFLFGCFGLLISLYNLLVFINNFRRNKKKTYSPIPILGSLFLLLSLSLFFDNTPYLKYTLFIICFDYGTWSFMISIILIVIKGRGNK